MKEACYTYCNQYREKITIDPQDHFLKHILDTSGSLLVDAVKLLAQTSGGDRSLPFGTIACGKKL